MISVIVVTYDSAACVQGCIASIRCAFPDAELIVVDNASRDDTVDAVRAASPDVRLIRNESNLGFGRACNRGAEEARGSHLLFVNPDVVVTNVDGHQLDELLGPRPFGLVAPVLEGEADRRRAHRTWVREYISHTYGTLLPRELHLRGRTYNGDADAWVSGALLFASREEFLGLGGFDPRFFLYYEDQDLSRRYREAGLPVRMVEAIRGRHVGGGSSLSDDLRAEPMAWSILGWIEYLWIHEGPASARRAARATLMTLHALRRGVGLLAIAGSSRGERKACQLDELLRLLSRDASVATAGYCVDALQLVRGTS